MEEFLNTFKEDIEIAESKLKSFTIRFNGQTKYVEEGELTDNFRQDFKEMLQVLKNKDFKEITTPCSVFMTFESEEGVERAKAH